MKGKRIVSSLLVSLFVVGLFVAFGDHAAQAATASFSSVRRLSDSSVVANATSSIIREAESVTVTQITTGLDPGAAREREEQDQEEGARGHVANGAGARGSVTIMVVPSPTVDSTSIRPSCICTIR